MPFVHIMIAGASVTPDQIASLQSEATGLMARLLRKDAAVTSVLVDIRPPGGWSIGAQPVPLAAHVDAHVTAGTNTPEEKAAFVAAAAALLRDTLGPALPLATYVVVTELPADAWGYDGLTQEARKRQSAAGR